MSKDLHFKMTQEYYFSLPDESRNHLTSKMMYVEDNDFNENMKDERFKQLYEKSKRAKKELEEWQFILRENRRKNQIK